MKSGISREIHQKRIKDSMNEPGIASSSMCIDEGDPKAEELKLEEHEVHVWSTLLDTRPDLARVAEQLLSPEERERASRFRFDRDRTRFISGHVILRTLLGRYLRIEPVNVQFSYGSYGKPSLANQERYGCNLSFNMSHSHHIAVYAFTHGRPIGVDVELLDSKPSLLEIAASFFSKYENAALHKLPAAQQTEGFFNCWTRKEAFLKAIGTGLSWPLDQFDVSLTPGQHAQLLRVQGDPRAASEWSLEAFTPYPGYAAAVAIKGRNLKFVHGGHLNFQAKVGQTGGAQFCLDLNSRIMRDLMRNPAAGYHKSFVFNHAQKHGAEHLMEAAGNL
jgi:4'-phosphopantetheinyl transferase